MRITFDGFYLEECHNGLDVVIGEIEGPGRALIMRKAEFDGVLQAVWDEQTDDLDDDHVCERTDR